MENIKEKEIMKKNFIQAIDNITDRFNNANTRYFGYSQNGNMVGHAKIKVFEDELIAINSYLVQVIGR